MPDKHTRDRERARGNTARRHERLARQQQEEKTNMGEYAMYRGAEIKIGTCVDMYYLRAEQRDQISHYEFDADQSARFRFPWPDEDTCLPGDFDPYNRSCPLPGLSAPAELAAKHDSVQFVAAAGYNVCLPCPERFATPGGAGPLPVAGLLIHRNGFRGGVLLCQQRFFEGKLVGIVECGGCGLKWRLSREDACLAAAALRAGAARRTGSEDWYLKVASRLMAGYLAAPAKREA